jgi:hypothetical protein
LRPLCFGEFGNTVSRRSLLANYGQLVAAANGKSLLIAVCPMPYSTTAQRRGVRDELIWAYNPSCQDEALQSPAEPALAQSAKAEPTRSPRHRIGFIAEPEPLR